MLGLPVAELHMVEFQIAWSTHTFSLCSAHKDKLRTHKQVDALICAELPDPVKWSCGYTPLSCLRWCTARAARADLVVTWP
jgi:hypothetical protein